MSVKVSLSVELSEEKTFPKIMIDEHNTIVLFYDESRGTVINSDEIYGVGYYSILWFAAAFKDYNGEVTLKNE
jgi:hypothetical protein